jgi:hypothetical protein
MKAMHSILFLIVLAALILSCRPALDLQSPENLGLVINQNVELANFSRVFEAYWQAMNNNYLFWDRDPADWDAVYDTYKGKFDALGVLNVADFNINGGDPNQEPLRSSVEKGRTAYLYFREITTNLIDGHYSISFDDFWKVREALIYPNPADRLFPYNIQPLDNKVRKRARTNNGVIDPALTTPGSGLYNADILFAAADTQKTYGTPWNPDDDTSFRKYDFMGKVIATYWNGDTGAGVNAYSFFGTPNVNGIWPALGHIDIPDDPDDGYILYFSFKSFHFGPAISYANAWAATNDEAKKALNIFYRFFGELEGDAGIDRSKIKGLIVDTRGNGGGNIQDLSRIWGHFIAGPLTFGHTRFKSAEGRLDYTPWVPMRIMPIPENPIPDTPVVLLVDRLSVSCAEISTMIVKQLQNGRVIGETTFGATSPFADNRLYNGGQFSSGPLWVHVMTASVMLKCADGNYYEGVGVPPDMPVDQDWTAFTRGASPKDNVLEAAIAHIKAGE